MVVGAGQVGRSVAKTIGREHEVVLVDINAERLEQVIGDADVMTYEGDITNLEVLEDAGVRETDVFISCTSDDQTNILSCSSARGLNSDIMTIARVKKTAYLRSWKHTRRAFNVDYMVGADYLTALEIVRFTKLRNALDIEFFARGNIEMAEFELSGESSLVGKTVRECDEYSGITFAGVYDGDTMSVARGDTRFEEGNRVVVIGRPSSVRSFGTRIDSTVDDPIRSVMILGGGEIGLQTAELLQEREITTKLVEQDPDRAQYLANQLSDTMVLLDDATDPEFLESERVSEVDVLVTALHPDDRNFFASSIGKYLGAEYTCSVLHQQKYGFIFDDSRLDVTVNPKQEVIEKILQYVRGPNVGNVSLIEDHRAEVLEAHLNEDSTLSNQRIGSLGNVLPDAVIIGAIMREGNFYLPRSDAKLKPGDHLVFFGETDVMDDLLALL